MAINQALNESRQKLGLSHNMPAFAGILHPGEMNDILTFLHTRDLPQGTQLGTTQQ